MANTWQATTILGHGLESFRSTDFDPYALYDRYGAEWGDIDIRDLTDGGKLLGTVSHSYEIHTNSYRVFFTPDA